MRRIKIAVLGTRGFPDVPGGVEKHCQELYPELVSMGCKVTVFTRRPYIPSEKRLKNWKGVSFIHLWCPRIKSLEAVFHTFIGMIFSFCINPDIIHIHAVGPSLFTPLAKIAGFKVVVTNHGPDYKREKWGKIAKLVLMAGEMLSAKFADKMIVISKGIKRDIERNYGRRDIIRIPNGVHLPGIISPGKTLKKYGLKERGYIFTACRFVPEKGVTDLIKAFGKLDSPDYKLVIAGSADHETSYSRTIRTLAGQTEGVVLTGYVSGKELGELYSNTGLFILPSYYEGLPIALLEALSYSLPVLVSDIPQNREVPLENCRYFRPGDIEELAEKIDQLFKKGIDKEERKKYYRLIKDRCNWKTIASKTFSEYRKLIS